MVFKLDFKKLEDTIYQETYPSELVKLKMKNCRCQLKNVREYVVLNILLEVHD